MARVGGRNAFLAWVVGIGCAALLAALVFLAIPLLPVATTWIGNAAAGPTAKPDAAAPEPTGPPAECDQLYGEALWAALRWADGAVLTPSKDAPTTTAAALVDALQPQVQLTCSWIAAAGTLTSTLATAPADAGSIAAAALPAVGFACEAVSDRTRCTRVDGELTETIETGGGLWLSSSETGWHPEAYASRVARAVWP